MRMSTTNAWENAQAAGEPNPIERIGSAILDQVLGKANARMVYGDPVQHGNRTVVPVARISTRFGFGGGSGRANRGDGPETGMGGGGGGSVDAKPIGYIEISDSGTEFRPIEDETQIAMAAMRIATIIVLALLVRFLFLRRGKKKAEQRAATRRRIPFRRGAGEPVVLEPAPPAARSRFRRRAA